MQPLTDRQRVNVAIEAVPVKLAQSVRLPVSEEFVEEMRDCVPPITMRYESCYNTIQVGEISQHDREGRPLYETYMQMNQAAIDQNLNDYSMIVNQWYFVGLKTQSKH